MNTFLKILVACFLMSQSVCFAQGLKYQSYAFAQVPLSGKVVPSKIVKDFAPSLRTLEMPKPGGEEYSALLEGIKKNIQEKQSSMPENKGYLRKPVLGINFEGNRYPSGVPNDNHMAISNSGIIVSMVNTTVGVFDTNGVIKKTWSFDAFSDTLKINAGKYDGRVLYDPVADRFIVVFLAGFNDSTSYAIIGFSSSADPSASWNLYKLPGSPLADKTWSDFPMVSITNDELFLTLNAIENKMSWQAGFKQSYIWQINKTDGYNGKALTHQLYTNISYNNKPIRNLCPVRGGAGLKGPECYFISNRNFDASNDTFFLVKLGGKINTPDTILSLTTLTSLNQYGVAPDARQAFHDTLQTNDCRVLDAFIENNTIQLVGNSNYFPSGRSGVYHGIISNVNLNPSIQLNLIGANKMDYGYPAIAYAGKSEGDDDAVIVLNYTSDSFYSDNNGKRIYIYPGYAVVFYKNNMYSDTFMVRKGNSIINMVYVGKDRWGDYSGIQLRYNHPGEVWAAATFGHLVRSGTGNVNAAGTWISQLTAPSNTVGIASINKTSMEVYAYPNPLRKDNYFSLDFTLEEEAILSFDLYDSKGTLVRKLMQTKADEGKNRFSFNLSALSSGIYILKISSHEGIMVNKKIIIN